MDLRRRSYSRRALLLVTVLAGLILVRPFSRVAVAGDSMSPTLVPGDRLLMRRGSAFRRGDLVVVREPGGLEVVKRLAAMAGDEIDLGRGPVRLDAGEVAVLGDSPGASTDSRTWGVLPQGAVRGRVVATYHPPERVRRW